MALEFNFKEAVKKPWVKWTLIIIGVVGGFFILRAMMGGGSSSAASASNQDLQAEAALQAQQNAIDAQNSQQASTISANAAAQTSAQQSQLALQQETDATALASQKEGDASSFQLAGVQLQGLLDQLTAQTTQQQATINGQVSLANITATEQKTIAAGQNALILGISNNQANVADTESNNAVAQSQIAANAAVQEQTLISNEQGLQSNNQTHAAVVASSGNLLTNIGKQIAGLF